MLSFVFCYSAQVKVHKIFKMPRQSPVLWNYFTKSVTDGDRVATCNKCKCEFNIVDGSTSTIRYHLKSKHPLDFAEMQRTQATMERQRTDELKQIKESAKDLDNAYGKFFNFF